MWLVREWLGLESFEGLTVLDVQDSFTAKFSALKGKAGRQHSAGTGDYAYVVSSSTVVSVFGLHI